MNTTAITFQVNVDNPDSLTDEALALLWRIGQDNPAPSGDPNASTFSDYLGREIIRRWLMGIPPGLWTRLVGHATISSQTGRA